MPRINFKALTEGRESNQITLPFDIMICHYFTNGGYLGKVKFPTRKNQNILEWSSISLPDWKWTGKPRRNKKEMALLIEWIKKYEYVIIEIGCKRLDFTTFYKFLKIFYNEKILDNFVLFKKEKTLLPLDIMLVNWKEFDYRNFPQIVVCLDTNLNFIGVVEVSYPEKTVFIEEFRGFEYNDISKWIIKYEEYIKGLAFGKVEYNEFLSKLEHDNSNYVYNESGNIIYDFKMDYIDESSPRSVMNFCDPILQKEFYGNVYYFGYRFKKYEELKDYYTKSDFDIIKSQLKIQLKEVNSRNWIGKKLIEKALGRLNSKMKVNSKIFGDINIIIFPNFKSNNLNDKISRAVCRFVRSLDYAEYKEIKNIPMIENPIPYEKDWYRKPRPEEEKIWFHVDQMLIDRRHYKIPDEEFEKEITIVNKIIDSFNKCGKFQINLIAKEEEILFRVHFRKYLKFEISIFNKDEDHTNILLVDENILTEENINTSNATLIEMITRTEELINATGGSVDDYKIFCFKLMGR
ncbi:MAG: hypothetical protein FWH18_00005 [Marinilabiliaceae bacterium]|nr:hypothetical protein [Marinilabiliaceae bacterium]